MKTIKDIRKWLTSLEQAIEDRYFLKQLQEMQIIARNVERDLDELFHERNQLIAENADLREELEKLKNRSATN